jgi:CcmD family protein
MQAPSPAPAPPAAPAQDEFVPISELPAEEQLPAGPLLIAAYAVVWIVIAVYLWTLWRRFLRAEQDVKSLSSRLPPAR